MENHVGKIKQQKIYDPGFAEQIGWRDKICYGIGGFGYNVFYIIISTFITYFYTNVAGIPIASVGTIFLISRIFDGWTDFIMGILINRTKSKYGKARPWLLWMSIPFAFSTVLMFMVPHTSMTLKLVFVFITYNLNSSIFGTAAFLPFNTLNSLMTRDQGQRTSLSNIRQIFCCACQLILTAITMPICTHFGNTQAVWIIVIGIYSVLIAVGGLVCFWGTRERAVRSEVQQTAKKGSAAKEFKSVLQNKFWYLAFMIWVFQTFYTMTNNTAVAYYAQYELKNVNLSASLLTIENTALVIGIFVCPVLLRFLDKRKLAMAGTAMAIVGQVLVLISPTNIIMLNVAAVIRGLGISPCSATVFAMISDTVEYGQWKTHVRSEGIIFSAATVGMKIVSGVGTWVIARIYSAAGFDGTLDVQSASAMGAIRNVYCFGVIIILALLFACLAMNTLENKYPQIMKDLEDRESKGSL